MLELLGVGRNDTPILSQRWAGLRWVIALAIVLRLVVALWSLRLSYPDEIFQYLEQAHRLAFGYGIVPWEYRFGIRNWLLPGILAGWLQALNLMGLGQPAFYVPATKCALALLSVSMVYACYVIGRNLFSEMTGRVAAIMVAVWYKCLYISTLPTPEVISTYAIVYAVGLATGPRSLRNVLMLGLLLGLGVSLREQYLPPVLCLGIVVFLRWGWRDALGSAAMASLVLAVAGLLDYWTWGIAFYSFYGSFQLNYLYHISNAFGREPVLWYINMLDLKSHRMYLLALVYSIMRWRRCWLLLVMVLAVLVPHSVIEHKEYRFIILAVPLLLVLLADATVEGLRLVRLVRPNHLWAGPAALMLFCAVSAAGCVKYEVFHRDNRLAADLQLAQQPHLAAVLDLTGSWASSGGYYYLHDDVPIYFAPQVKGMDPSHFREFASHILIRADRAIPPGFTVVSTHGSILLLAQTEPPSRYRRLPVDSTTPRAPPKVEGHLKPAVTPRI